MGDKKCPRCQQTLPLESFTRSTQHPDGRFTYCRACKRAYARAYNKAPRVREQTKRANLRRCYGISLEEYRDLYVQQNGMCALCGQRDQGIGGKYDGLHVDHDHRTGKIRGLLCNTCNRALGLFKDDQTVLERAVRYLEFHNG